MVGMLRLSAQLDKPYRIAISAAADDGTLAGTITDPAGASTALSLTVDGAVHVHPFTPSVLGDHVVEITASDDAALVGLQMTLVVSTLGPADLVVDHTVTDPACGQPKPVRWPCPTLKALPCIDEYTAADVARWMGRANSTLFRDTAARFPGCYWYATIRPNVSARCLTATPAGGLAFDLFDTLRYPALELIEVNVDGTPTDLADWSIESERWLVPAENVAWPAQDWHGDLGSPGTWSVMVRYGRAPDPLVVDARDMFAYSMLLSTCLTSSGNMACKLPDGTTQISENGRSIQIDPQTATTALWGEVKKRFAANSWDLSQIIDPAEHTARSSRHARIVASTPPASHAVWLNSGCDLTAELAAL